MLSAASDGRWIVWTEADDAPGFLDWRLRAFDLQTHAVRGLARAVEHNGKPIPGPLSDVAVNHGLAVWGQAIGTGVQAGQTANAVVREADLATGEITTLATSAGSPQLSWPWLPGRRWIRSRRASTSRTSRPGTRDSSTSARSSSCSTAPAPSTRIRRGCRSGWSGCRPAVASGGDRARSGFG